jgi:DNA-binding GntR family transcriptional regulator
MDDDRSLIGLTSSVVNRSLGDEVVDRLREGIVTGVLKPGEHLREANLSAAMEVSRSPIRDAFAQLQHEGLVTLRRHHGAVVVAMTAEDIEEVFSLRVTLETLAVTRSIELADAHDIANLRAAAARVPKVQAVTDLKEYADLDLAFHDLIFCTARHQKLFQCWTMLRPHIFRFLVSSNIANKLGRNRSDHEHDELAEVIATQDRARATAMIERHLAAAYQRWLEGYRDFADRAVVQDGDGHELGGLKQVD